VALWVAGLDPGGGEATSVLARTASGDVQPSAWLAAWVAAAIRSGAGGDPGWRVGACLGRRGRRDGLRPVRWYGQRPEFVAVEHPPLHLVLDTQGRTVLEQPGGVDHPLAQHAQQRPEVLLAAVAQQRRPGRGIDVAAIRDHLQPLVGLQAVDRPHVHPAGVGFARQQILAAKVGLQRDHRPLFQRVQGSR
jgi:hypothetical protein